MRSTAVSVAAACAIVSVLAVADGQAPQNQPTAPNPAMCEGQPGAAAAPRGGGQPGGGPAAPGPPAQPQTPVLPDWSFCGAFPERLAVLCA